MMIDLTQLHSLQVPEISIDENYSLKDSFSHPEIIDLSDISVTGVIILRDEKECFVGLINGTMTILDSISLEEVFYPFCISFDDYIPENYIKNENTLDILGFLWENIVLEVPLRFTKVQDLSKFQGDGWRVISEEEINHNNPFRELLKDFKEE